MFVKVPKYDEFSVADVWKQVRKNPKINVYFKDYSEKAVPNRKYLYNVRYFNEAIASTPFSFLIL